MAGELRTKAWISFVSLLSFFFPTLEAHVRGQCADDSLFVFFLLSEKYNKTFKERKHCWESCIRYNSELDQREALFFMCIRLYNIL